MTKPVSYTHLDVYKRQAHNLIDPPPLSGHEDGSTPVSYTHLDVYKRQDFNLDIPKGKIVSVFGPNGCGKSTLINMIAGLIPIDAGEILFDGKSLAQTKIGYVFQNYREAMFPWLRTIDNIAYPLRLEGRGKAEVDARVEELVASFDVKFDLKRYPYELSGGQQQTASITVSYTHLDVYKRQDADGAAVAERTGADHEPRLAAARGAQGTCLLYTSRCV